MLSRRVRPCYSKDDLWIRSMDLSKDAEFYAPPILNQNLHYDKIFKWFGRTLKFEKHRSSKLALIVLLIDCISQAIGSISNSTSLLNTVYRVLWIYCAFLVCSKSLSWFTYPFIHSFIQCTQSYSMSSMSVTAPSAGDRGGIPTSHAPDFMKLLL